MKLSVLFLALTSASLSLYAQIPVPGRLIPVTGSLITSSFTTGSSPDITHFSPSGQFVTTVNGNDGSLSVFSVNQTTGIYTSLGTVFSGGPALSFAYSHSGKTAVVVNDMNGLFPHGSITAFVVTSAGLFVPAVNNSALGSSTATKDVGSSVAYAADDSFVVVGEFATGQLEVFTPSSTGLLQSTSTIATQAHPLGVVFSPDGRFLTSVNEQSLTVFAVQNGSLTYSNGTLANSTFNVLPNVGVAQGVYSPNGKFFSLTYASTNFITVYNVNQQTGALTPINTTLQASSFATAGFNTSLAYTPNGEFLVVTNTLLNTATTFGVDPATGALSTNLVSDSVPTQLEPVFIEFSPAFIFATVANTNSNTLTSFRIFSVLSFTTVVTPGNCFTNQGGTIIITGTGGIPPYKFSLGNGTFQTSNVFTNVAPGSYLITIEDTTGLTISQTITVPASTRPVTTNSLTNFITALYCSGGCTVA